MLEENTNQEFTLSKIDYIRNYLIEEIYQNKLMSKKHKKVVKIFLVVVSTIIGWVSILIASLVSILIGIMNCAIRLKTCAITAAIKSYKPIIKKKKKKHDKIVLLAKSKLNRIEVLISKALIDSNISRNEFVMINNKLQEFYDIKEEF